MQAAIAALHAPAARAEQIDWRQIAALYEALRALSPSPVVELNYAAALGMAYGSERGLALIDHAGLAGPLDDYLWLHSTRAELLRRMSRFAEAAAAYKRALQLADNASERAFLRRRLAEVEAGGTPG